MATTTMPNVVEPNLSINVVDMELNKARDGLRQLDDDIRNLTGRNPQDLSSRFGRGRGGGGGGNRFAPGGLPFRQQSLRSDSHESGSRMAGDGGRFGAGGIGQKRRITYTDRESRGMDGDDGRSTGNGYGEQWKRPRLSMDYSRPARFSTDANMFEPRAVKPVVQSSVTMPIKDTKSREEAISELKGTEKKEVAVRNRRMFGVLLGTLQKFKTEEQKHNFKEQEKKQKEIESRLEDVKRKEHIQMEKEKQRLLEKRMRQEHDIRRLRRKRALISATENQIALLKRLQNFIQTNAKPPVFFMPVKHSIRTIELQKKSQKRLDEMIKRKKEEADEELKQIDEMDTSGLHMHDEEDDDNESVHAADAQANKTKTEILCSSVSKVDHSETTSIDVTEKEDEKKVISSASANGEEENVPDAGEVDESVSRQNRPHQEPSKPKDIHEELKELTSGYVEELNFEDDDQQNNG